MWTGNLSPASNREAWSETVSYRPADGTAAPVPDEIVVAISAPTASPVAPAGFCLLSKTLSGGGIVNDAANGSFSFVFPVDEMRRLQPGAHTVGMVLTLAGTPVQLFTGSIEILDGVIP